MLSAPLSAISSKILSRALSSSFNAACAADLPKELSWFEIEPVCGGVVCFYNYFECYYNSVLLLPESK